MHTPRYHEGSVTIQRCHHSLTTLLVLSMVAIFRVPLHHIAIRHIGIERVSFHKTVFLPVILIFNLSFAILGGKGLRWMPRSSKEDCKRDFKYQTGITTWLMRVTCHRITTSSLLTMGSGTILPSGAGPIKSK